VSFFDWEAPHPIERTRLNFECTVECRLKSGLFELPQEPFDPSNRERGCERTEDYREWKKNETGIEIEEKWKGKSVWKGKIANAVTRVNAEKVLTRIFR
jgi:hypothetical protein